MWLLMQRASAGGIIEREQDRDREAEGGYSTTEKYKQGEVSGGNCKMVGVPLNGRRKEVTLKKEDRNK